MPQGPHFPFLKGPKPSAAPFLLRKLDWGSCWLCVGKEVSTRMGVLEHTAAVFRCGVGLPSSLKAQSMMPQPLASCCRLTQEHGCH